MELKTAHVQGERLSNLDCLKVLPSIMPHLESGKQHKLVTLIRTFPEILKDVPSHRPTTVLEHSVDVGGAAPIRQHPYRVNARKRELMRKETGYLLEHDMAEPSSSPWSSPCILVPKPDGTARLCTDYRRVNAVTVPESFPMPCALMTALTQSGLLLT